MNINNVTLGGRITSDAELRFSQKGTPVCSFRLAVNDRRTDHTSFVNIVCFNKQVETLNEHLVKGRAVGVTGKLKIEQYEKDGVKRESFSVIANDIELGQRAGSKEEE